MEQSQETKPSPKLRSRLRSIAEAILIAFCIVTFGVNTVGISGDSMAPSLRDGERAFVPKYEVWARRIGIGEFQRGEVVYFRPPPGIRDGTVTIPLVGLQYRPFFIKRIIALPGESVRIEQGTVYVDGTPLSEEHLGSQWRGSGSMSETLVPDGHVFVLGDNRGPFGSVDSRRFGPIPINAIAGRATTVIWPLVTRNDNGDIHINLRRLETPQLTP